MIFDLPHYKQVGKPKKVDNKYNIQLVIDKQDKAILCPKCHSDNVVKYGSRKHNILDIPFNGLPTKLTIKKNRYLCNTCQFDFFESLIDVNDQGKMTIRLLKYLQECIEKQDIPYQALSKEIGISVQSIRRMAHNIGKNKIDRNIRFETPAVLGIHEFNLYHTSVFILTNIEAGTVLNIIPKRNIESILEQYLDSIPDKNKLIYLFADVQLPFIKTIKQNLTLLGFAETKLIIDKNILSELLVDNIVMFLLETAAKYNEDVFTKEYLESKISSNLKNGLDVDAIDIILSRHPAPNIGQLFREGRTLYNLINAPSKEGLSLLDNGRTNPDLDIKSVVLQFKQEIINSVDFKLPETYLNDIQILHQNLATLKDTYSLAKIWEELKGTKESKPISKLVHNYHMLLQTQHHKNTNAGMSITILIQALTP